MIIENNATTTDFQSWFIPLDIFNIISCALAASLSLLFILIIISDKNCYTVPMMLVANSCIAELIFSSDMLVDVLLKLYNDVRQIYYYNAFCLSLAAIAYFSVSMQNYSYLLQAIYRYILIVHPSQIFYQSTKFQLCLISFTWICGTIYPIALILTDQIKYHPDDQQCQMPINLSFMTIFNAFYIYFIPMFGIGAIYFKMILYVREMSTHVTPANTLFHAKRELKIIRRLVSLVVILVALGVPYTIFIFMAFFNRAPKYHFRIAFTFVYTSVFFVLLALLGVTDPLKIALMKHLKFRPTNIVQATT